MLDEQGGKHKLFTVMLKLKLSCMIGPFLGRLLKVYSILMKFGM